MNHAPEMLRTYGLSSCLSSCLERSREPGATTHESPIPAHPGRVVAAHRDAFTVMTRRGEKAAVLAGSLRSSVSRRIELPTVGDWVELAGAEDAGTTMIRRVLPRTGVLIRKQPGKETEAQPIAANVDTVCIVLALDYPRNHHPRSVERYLTAVWDSGARPVIVLNKADLSEDPEAARASIEYAAPGVEIVVASCATGEGVTAVTELFDPASTIVLLGRSGVGKSSLLNVLAGETLTAVGDVRDADRKGRHTTTVRELRRLDSGLLVIDTPGLREFAPYVGEHEDQPTAGGLDHAFDDIAALAESCRFRDCSHSGEPGCAVQAALTSGEVDHARFESYQHLQRELAWLRSREDQRAREAVKAKNRRLGRDQRQFKKKSGHR